MRSWLSLVRCCISSYGRGDQGIKIRNCIPRHSSLIPTNETIGQRQQRISFPMSYSNWDAVWKHSVGRQIDNGRKSTTRHMSTLENSNGDRNVLVLYERNSTERNKIPRAAIGVSFFNTTYWSWYCWDFIPAVNASPIESMHINPSVGLAGVAIGLLINSVALLYPSMLVSKLTYNQTSKSLQIYMYNLPFLTLPNEPAYEYELGSDFSIDPLSSDGRKILNELDGKIQNYTGHLGVSVPNRWIPMLLDIQETNEIKRPMLMLQAMFRPSDLLASSPAPSKGVSPSNSPRHKRVKKAGPSLTSNDGNASPVKGGKSEKVILSASSKKRNKKRRR